MEDIMIRLASEADIEAMAELLNELFSIERDFTPNIEKQKQGLKLVIDSNSAYAVVAEYKNQVIGMCTMQLLISTSEGQEAGLVEDLVVSQLHRRSGIGTALISFIEEKAFINGINRLQLLADRDNTSALDFYAKEKWGMTNLVCLRKMRA